MKRYTIEFSARRIGALGKLDRFIRTVEAESQASARIKLYDDFEHITVISVKEETPAVPSRFDVLVNGQPFVTSVTHEQADRAVGALDYQFRRILNQPAVTAIIPHVE